MPLVLAAGLYRLTPIGIVASMRSEPVGGSGRIGMHKALPAGWFWGMMWL